MKKLLLSILVATVALNASAIEIKLKVDSTKKIRYTLNLTGRIETIVHSDSYKTVDSRNGTQYLMPARPSFDPLTGQDVNQVGQLRFNAAPTRLGIAAGIIFNEKTSINAVVETDFMGVSDNIMQSLRLRHAYFQLNLSNSSILIGQTSHLALVEEIAAPTVSYGSGYPINPLARPAQIRFTQKFAKICNIAIAASMFTGEEAQAQAWSMTPDISLRLMVGDPKKNVIGILGGYKSLMPKLDVVANKNERLNAFYGGIFGRATIANGYAIRAFAIYGGDLTTLGMTGGYAPLKDHQGYTALNTVSAWIDFATPRFAGFEFGIFGGYQQNLGSITDIDQLQIKSAGSTLGIQNFWRVAPRVWYHFKMLSFGFEYMYSQAIWGHQWNDRYQGTINFAPTHNNRYTLLARFTF